MKATKKSEHTILLVEDNPDIQKFVRHILRSRPHIKIMSASTVKEGVKLAH